MKAIDFVKMSLEMSNAWIMGIAADMADAPLVRPTPNGGNHPLWCVAHMTYAEGNLVDVLCQGKPNPVADWESRFDMGTTPSDDASIYPSYEEVLAKAAEVRAATMEYVETLTDEDLDKPSTAEGDMAQWFGTIGQCLAGIPVHVGYHGGQIADCRRADGRPPLMGLTFRGRPFLTHSESKMLEVIHKRVAKFERVLKTLEEAGISPPANTQFLDFGCGAGETVAAALKHGLNAEGYDIVERLDSEKYGDLSDRCKFNVPGISLLPFDDNTFDLVLQRRGLRTRQRSSHRL